MHHRSSSNFMAQKGEMKLLGHVGSAFTNRVKFALKLKSIEYESIEENLVNKSELLIASNPFFQKVPVLFHANKEPIIESLAIMEYLDEIEPDVHPLLPSDPSERVQCRILAYTFDTLHYPWLREFALTRDNKRKEELRRLVIQGFVKLEKAFVKLSKGKAFFGGDDIGYLDIAIGVFLGWFKLFETILDFNVYEEARTPKLEQWAKSMWSHEVTRRVIPSHEIHMEFLKMINSTLPPLPSA